METIERAVLTFVFGIAFFAALVLAQDPVMHGTPSMTPRPAPAPRVAPAQQQIAKATATPLPRPGF